MAIMIDVAPSNPALVTALRHPVSGPLQADGVTPWLYDQFTCSLIREGALTSTDGAYDPAERAKSTPPSPTPRSSSANTAQGK